MANIESKVSTLVFSPELENCEDREALWLGIVEALTGVGFKAVIYLSASDDLKNVELLTNQPSIFEDTEPQSDPFLHYCCKSYDITKTGGGYLSEHAYLPEPMQEFVRRAAKTGLISGLGIPTRIEGAQRFGGFNIVSSYSVEEFEKLFVPYTERLQVFCFLAHRRLEETKPNSVRALLTPREIEVLEVLASGLSRKECARKLGLSPNTVAEYSKSGYRKIGAKNRADAARLLNGYTA